MSDTHIAFINRALLTTAEERKRTLARRMVNCVYPPPGYSVARTQAWQAQAYHHLRPYPVWHFTEWKTEERGPLPRCMPLARGIVKKGAKWLFGKDVQITVSGNLELEQAFRKAWLKNEMRTRMVHGAELGGVQGGIVLKWSYDDTADCPLRFQVLSTIDECRLFADPHDRNSILMLRVQYPVWNPQDGEYYLYREEWTDEEEIHYKPVPCRFRRIFGSGSRESELAQLPYVQVGNELTDPDTWTGWEMVSRTANPFGMIPAVPIRNIDSGTMLGMGDLWTDESGGIYRVLDRVNLAYHLMDRSNQFDSTPTPIFIDASEDEEELPVSLAPGSALSIKSDKDPAETSSKQAKVELLEPSGKLRDAITTYAHDLRQMLLDAVGSVMLDSSEITNKGNLTQAVLNLIYAPLIEATEQKRQTYGEAGIAKALERVALSLKNLSANASVSMEGINAVNPGNEETFDVQLQWPDYFPLGEDEKTARITRITSEMQSGLIDHERAIEIVAKTEGIDDVQGIKDELKEEMDRQATMRQAEAETAIGNAKQANLPPEPASKTE